MRKKEHVLNSLLITLSVIKNKKKTIKMEHHWMDKVNMQHLITENEIPQVSLFCFPMPSI